MHVSLQMMSFELHLASVETAPPHTRKIHILAVHLFDAIFVLSALFSVIVDCIAQLLTCGGICILVEGESPCFVRLQCAERR